MLPVIFVTFRQLLLSPPMIVFGGQRHSLSKSLQNSVLHSLLSLQVEFQAFSINLYIYLYILMYYHDNVNDLFNQYTCREKK